MKLRYTYKIRPGAQARSALCANAGASRWVWNKCVEIFNARNFTSEKDLMVRLTRWRKEHEWLQQLPVVPQQQTIRAFTRAVRAFFNKTAKPPRFKSKHSSKKTLNYTRRGFSLKEGRLVVAGKVSLPVVWSRDLPSEPSSVTVYEDSIGDWWASFVVDIDETFAERTDELYTGIDWGVIQVATTNHDDLNFHFHGKTRQWNTQLARVQRRMALHRRNQDWSAYRKAKRQAAKLHRSLKRTRKEQIRQWAQKVARNSKVVAAEQLSIRFIAKNKKLSKKALDGAIGIAKQELEQACRKYKTKLVWVNPAYTSQECSQCNTRAKIALTLSNRVFTCSSCGYVADRDKNASRNMLHRAGYNPAEVDAVRLDLVRKKQHVDSGIPCL